MLWLQTLSCTTRLNHHFVDYNCCCIIHLQYLKKELFEGIRTAGSIRQKERWYFLEIIRSYVIVRLCKWRKCGSTIHFWAAVVLARRSFVLGENESNLYCRVSASIYEKSMRSFAGAETSVVASFQNVPTFFYESKAAHLSAGPWAGHFVQFGAPKGTVVLFLSPNYRVLIVLSVSENK